MDQSQNLNQTPSAQSNLAESPNLLNIPIKIKYPFWSKFWFSWIFLTALYLIIWAATNGLESKWTPLTLLGSFIGIFVPVGFWTATFGFGDTIIFNTRGYALARVFGILAVVLLLFCLFRADRYIEGYNLSITKKIFINLLILVLLTLIFDLVFWGHWESLLIILNGGFGDFSL